MNDEHQINQDLNEVRTNHQFKKFIDKWWGRDSEDHELVKVLLISEDTWNRILAMSVTDRLDAGTVKFGGDVTLEIDHSLGVMILINRDYRG